MKRLLLATFIFCAGLTASAQKVVLPEQNSGFKVPRLHLEKVQSMNGAVSGVLDTIPTQTPGVNIVLYADKSWRYVRDPEDAMRNELFSEYWDTEAANPYADVKMSDFPDKISLWIVDTLSDYRCPRQTKVYSPFGMRRRRRHQGVDLPLVKGEPVYAAFSGKVRVSKYFRGYGNLVVLRHENGLETYYAHLSERKVTPGQWVDAGAEIGLGGSTGRSTGAHLHFETRYCGYAFDPQWLIDFETGDLRHRLFVLKKKHLSPLSKYVPESEEEENEIFTEDSLEHAAAEKAAAEAAAAKYHKVRSGDTLSRIARRYGTTVSAICKLNEGLKPSTTLKIGRRIRVK